MTQDVDASRSPYASSYTRSAEAEARLVRLADARLYLCLGPRPGLAAFLDEVVAAGVDVVQLREKGLEWQPEADELAVVRQVARPRGALVAANDRADLAAFTGVDVLHVGQHDIPPRLARRLLGPDVLIGLSTHDPDQLAAAIEDPDVDYFCVGPVWATPTKQGRAPVGLELPRLAARLAPPFTPGAKPWFVTGGVDAATLDDVLGTGARRVVVVRGITQDAEPGPAAAALAARLRAA
ncbi:thiamine phosphate synthase [Frankia sp. CiP1_Cm_nod2]|uniref:thiamine phosphate synthase n=1 Tax=Frankia sp. CiP1_Cm_nod2 TaxID=2897161 RepID=UPI002023EE7E